MIGSVTPDVVVTELSLADGSGWELVSRCSTEKIIIPILVFTAYDEEIYASRLLRAGAKGFLMKTSPVPEVIAGLRRIARGYMVVSEQMSSQMIQIATRGVDGMNMPNELSRLSDRELQVLELLCKKRIGKEIAASMGISEKTVCTYKARLMEKFNTRTTAELLKKMIGVAGNKFGLESADRDDETLVY